MPYGLHTPDLVELPSRPRDLPAADAMVPDTVLGYGQNTKPSDASDSWQFAFQRPASLQRSGERPRPAYVSGPLPKASLKESNQMTFQHNLRKKVESVNT